MKKREFLKSGAAGVDTRNHLRKFLPLFTVTLLLAACGGGESTTTATTAAQGSATITGLVQQGNIVGAKVFLDLNGNGVQDAVEPGASNLTGTDGTFTLSLTGEQVTALKAASTTAKIVSAGGTDKTTGLDAGLLASDLPAVTGASATKNITPMTTLMAMTPDAQKGDLKTVLGTLGLKDSSGSANDDMLIETATPAVIALCKSVESALLNVQKSTSVAVAQAAAAEMGKALSRKKAAEITDTAALAATLSAAAGTAFTTNNLTAIQVSTMVAAISKGCKDVADLVKSKTGGSLSTDDHSKKESEIMTEVGGQIKSSVETASAEVEAESHGHGSAIITGLVQQGNIAGAKVFLDLNGNGVQDAGEPVASNLTGFDGTFKLPLTGEQVTALKAASATAKIVSAGGTDKTTGLDAGLLASDLPAVTGSSATKNITPMTTLMAMTPDAQKADLKTVLGTLGLKDSSGSANDDMLIETATPAVIALCKSVESALLNVQKSTSVAVAQAAAAEMGKALSRKKAAEITDTAALATTLSAAAGTAFTNNNVPTGQVSTMVASISKGCKDVADLVKSRTGGSLSTDDHSKKESEIMTEVGGQIKSSVDTSTSEVEAETHSH